VLLCTCLPFSLLCKLARIAYFRYHSLLLDPDMLATIVTSAITTFLIGRMYLNFQYHKSNAGYRQGKIIAATQEIKAGWLASIPEADALRNKYKSSLGLVIERLVRTYGTLPAAGAGDLHPLLHHPGHADAWSFFETHVRPVKADLNNNAFIGWIPVVPNVKKLTTLWEMCHQLENIVIATAEIQALEKKYQAPVLAPEGDYAVRVKVAGEPEMQARAAKLLKEYKLLQGHWYQWLKLIGA
jgi:hypothetical protein